MDRKRIQFLLEIAILGALSFVLDNLTLFKFPQGGSITLSMLPIILIAYRWGVAGGLLTGLISGLLQAVMGGYIIHPVQGALDYFIAFTVVGFAASTHGWLIKSKLAERKGQMAAAIIVGTTLGGLLRFLAHFIGGMVFFADAAGDQPVWLYSLLYNGAYMIPSIILCAVVAVILFTSSPRLIQRT